jgi:hypothetical protein
MKSPSKEQMATILTYRATEAMKRGDYDRAGELIDELVQLMDAKIGGELPVNVEDRSEANSDNQRTEDGAASPEHGPARPQLH